MLRDNSLIATGCLKCVEDEIKRASLKGRILVICFSRDDWRNGIGEYILDDKILVIWLTYALTVLDTGYTHYQRHGIFQSLCSSS